MKKNWKFNSEFGMYESTNGKVYVCISELLFGFKLQLFLANDISVCELEVQTSEKNLEKFIKLVELGEEWLSEYGDDISKLNENFYSINNMNGCWNKDRELKQWLISGSEG